MSLVSTLEASTNAGEPLIGPVVADDSDGCGHTLDPYSISADGVSEYIDQVPAGSKGTIAIDMDDVLCNTNGTIVDMHADLFPTKADPPIRLDEFEHYLYWHNRGWGTQTETVDMVGQLYRAGLMDRPRPLAGVRDALANLKSMGYRLIVITARSEVQREGTEAWLEQHIPDIFDELHFTGAFNHLIPATIPENQGHAAKRAVVSHKKRSKHEVMQQTGALFLVDDSAENALAAAAATPPVRVLLFGAYPWNAEIVPPTGPESAHPHDKLLYIEREKHGLLGEAKERREARVRRGWLPDGVERVSGWDDVLAWVRKHNPVDEEASA